MNTRIKYTTMAQFKIECVESKNDTPREQYGKFIIQPLEIGQGITIGNALRRILLSDLQGSAVTAVRIAGVNHEFSTIPGIREDVLEITLNLREIVLKNSTKDPIIGKLNIKGPSIIRAGDFTIPPEVKIIDPMQYIATICNNTSLEMECIIENGKGYRIGEKFMANTQVDFLQIDAVFMPVRKVNYNVEEIKLNSENLKDKLTLEIWTNGSLSPQDALNQGSTILAELFGSCKTMSCRSEKEEEVDDEEKIEEVDDEEEEEEVDDEEEEEEDMSVIKGIPIEKLSIEALNFPTRAYNCLKQEKIKTVANLLKYSVEDLLKIKSFGQRSANAVVRILKKRLDISLPKRKS
jgi:DNA-directed RNA polymerase subunit alpha